MSNVQQKPIDYTSKDYASLLTALLDVATERFPEWTDRSPNDLGTMLLELFASMGDSLFYNQDRIAGESFLETAVERRSVVQLLRLIGYELKPPLAASADLTLLFKYVAPGASSSKVVISQFATFKTTAAATGTPVTFQYIQQTPTTIQYPGNLPVGIVDATGALAVLAPGTPAPAALPAGSTAYLVYKTLPVVQVDANVANEVVASSDGSAGQRYSLARAPVLDGPSLVVTVDEGGGPEVWTAVANLLESAATDASYAVRRDEDGVVWLEFGDGTYGKAPRRGLNNITASYCVGGGAKGNVPPGAIAKVVTAIDPLKLVMNGQSASGGTDAEATADAARRGPLLFRSMGRAVTASDYEALARTFGVAKAKALSAAWNNVRLIVAPAGGGVVSETFKKDLLAFLDGKRMMTVLVEIADPSYVPVLIDATVTVLPQFSQQLVQQQVEDAVATLFAFDNVDFGQRVFLSKVYEVIQDVDGVQGVVISTFARQDPAQPAAPIVVAIPGTGQLVFEAAKGELPRWSGFTVVASLPGGPSDGTQSRLIMQQGGVNG